MNPAAPAHKEPVRRSGNALAAFLFGVPLGLVILGSIHFGPLHDETVVRYVSHPVECVTVVLFCCALGALGTKMRRSVTERRACRTAILPAWDGKAVQVSEAGKLLGGLGRIPARLQNTYLFRRVHAVLEFLCQRGSATELDDQMRSLSDNDVMTLEASYSLTRFITWAIPILGFLGTVLGITQAISGVTPDKLEAGLNSVTDGLATAFDATALALGLTMITMFCSFLVERTEQGFLEEVDRYAERELAHRFVRLAADSEPFVAVVKQNSQVLVDATEKLVERQAKVWLKSFTETEQRHAQLQAQSQDTLTSALAAALEKTLDSHARRMKELERQGMEQSSRILEQMTALAAAVRDTSREQQASLKGIADALASQTAALGSLQEQEQHLVHLQSLLQQNLQALAGSGAFEEAVHSLTAAIHLLTARAQGRVPPEHSPPLTVPFPTAGTSPGPKGKVA
jgi:hypothetical protein